MWIGAARDEILRELPVSLDAGSVQRGQPGLVATIDVRAEGEQLVDQLPVVRAGGKPRGGNLRLSLSIQDTAGALCNTLRIAGDRPDKPAFVITTATGEIVKRGHFAFG